MRNWPTAFVAVAFVALVGVMFWKAVDSGDFATIWAGVGSIVGVVAGAIPSFFFRQDAQQASQRAQVLALHVPEDKVEQAKSELAALS